MTRTHQLLPNYSPQWSQSIWDVVSSKAIAFAGRVEVTANEAQVAICRACMHEVICTALLRSDQGRPDCVRGKNKDDDGAWWDRIFIYSKGTWWQRYLLLNGRDGKNVDPREERDRAFIISSPSLSTYVRAICERCALILVLKACP